MVSEIELAKKRLFDKDGLNIDNIKLFPGSSRDATPEAVAGQINRVMSHLEAYDSEEIKDITLND